MAFVIMKTTPKIIIASETALLKYPSKRRKPVPSQVRSSEFRNRIDNKKVIMRHPPKSSGFLLQYLCTGIATRQYTQERIEVSKRKFIFVLVPNLNKEE